MASQKKMAVYLAVKNAGTPLSFAEIMQLLGSAFSERSVRRWLGELVTQGKIEKSGARRSVRYQRAMATEPKALYIHQPLFTREPVGYQENWLVAYEPNVSYYLTQTQRQELHAVSQQQLRGQVAGTYIHQIYQQLLIDLSFNSSRLEGNTYSRVETEQLLLEGKVQPSKLDEEAVMILNHKEAIRYLVENAAQLQLNTDTLLTLHYLLADGLVPAQYAGKVRDHHVRVGGSAYIPAEGQAFLLRQLSLICEKASSIEDIFEQSFFLLVHLAYLQAFHDVNKRTSRLAANIPLIRFDVIPLSFNDVDKDTYIDAMLMIYECHDTSHLARIYCETYKRSSKQYQILLKPPSIDAVRVTFRAQRRMVIREIVKQKINSSAQHKFIQHFAQSYIPKKHHDDFIKSVQEDIQQLSPSAIYGLGVSLQDLEIFLKK